MKKIGGCKLAVKWKNISLLALLVVSVVLSGYFVSAYVSGHDYSRGSQIFVNFSGTSGGRVAPSNNTLLGWVNGNGSNNTISFPIRYNTNTANETDPNAAGFCALQVKADKDATFVLESNLSVLNNTAAELVIGWSL